MKKKLFIIVAGVMTAMAVIAATVQTLNVRLGEVIYQYATDQVGRMALSSNGTVATILNKVFNLNEVDEMYLDETPVTDNMVYVTYSGTTAQVRVAGNIAQYVNVVANGAHVAITQDATFPGDDLGEITYVLSGTSTNGSFWMDGSYKMTLELDGVSLTNPDSAAINIRDGKRIAVTLVDGTTNTLVDGANGSQKGCFAVKGHAEFTGGGSLTITGNTSHAFWGKEYVQFKKKLTGSITVNKAVGDGFNVNQYIEMNGGTITISGVGDDGMQLSQSTDDAGVVEEDVDNTGVFTMNGGTLNVTTTASGAKGIKAAVDYVMTGGTVTINQTGGYTYDGTDASYCAGIKTDGNINITGGTVNITSTADGGRGLGADGTINIDQTSATTNIDIKANGAGGVLEQNAEPGSGSGSTETPKSYKVYINYNSSSSGGYGPGGGGSNLWKNIYLYKSDGTYVGQLTNSVVKSSGYSSYTFYYYDFQAASDETYYFKSDNYTSGGGWSGGTTYTIVSETFSVPNGSDVYYQMSRDGYTTSGSTRTFSLNNVTSTYGGSSESSEDNGESYNASGLKADGNITIGGGTITIANSGDMSKSIKSKATATVNGGNLTLTPSGKLRVINNDASYSTGIKALDCVINGGTLVMTVGGQCGKGISVGNNTSTNGILTVNGGSLTVNLTSGATGYGSASAGNRHTAKGLKSDGHMYLNAGTINVSTVTAGAKAIKVNGNYYQGTSGGDGPTITLSTTGSRYGTSGSTGGMGGKTTGQGGAAKCIKAEGTCTLYGGETVITTQQDGGEGLEGKSGVTISGGKHYLKCYDDCISSTGKVMFTDGATVCYSFGNDAVDSNYGSTGAITIGNGAVLAYSSKGGAEEGLDCDNNNRIAITGNGYAISAGGSQGGGGWGGSSSSIGSASQGYYLGSFSGSFSAGRYYTIQTSSNTPLVTFSFEATAPSTLSLMTAKGMVKGTTYYVKYSTSAPTNATTAWHGLYLGSSSYGTTSFGSFTAQ